MINEITYSENILKGFKYLLDNDKDVFLIGQGLWSPWYVGNSMKDLDKIYGKKGLLIHLFQRTQLQVQLWVHLFAAQSQ